LISGFDSNGLYDNDFQGFSFGIDHLNVESISVLQVVSDSLSNSTVEISLSFSTNSVFHLHYLFFWC